MGSKSGPVEHGNSDSFLHVHVHVHGNLKRWQGWQFSTLDRLRGCLPVLQPSVCLFLPPWELCWLGVRVWLVEFNESHCCL